MLNRKNYANTCILILIPAIVLYVYSWNLKMKFVRYDGKMFHSQRTCIKRSRESDRTNSEYKTIECLLHPHYSSTPWLND